MHCNMRPPEPRQSFSALITTPCQVWSRWKLPYYSVIRLIHYFTLWPWPLTFNLEHLQRIACDMMKLCTKFERNRAICSGVIAISVFDLMTLNIALRVTLGSGEIFTEFDLRQLIRAWIITFVWCWYILSRCDLDLLQHFGCHAFKLRAKFERNRILHCWVQLWTVVWNDSYNVR